MKKSVYSILAALAVVFALVSCAKEAQTPDDEVAPKEVEAVEEQEELVELTLIAGNPEAEPATKTEMVGSAPYWSVGDAIGVSNGTSTNYRFETAITSPSTTATFTGATSVSSTLYAYYPFQSNGSKPVTEYGAKVDIAATQQPTASSFDGAADIMVAKGFTVDPASTTVSDLEFKRLGAIVKVVLKDADSKMAGTQHPSSVSLTAESDLVGRVYIDMVNQEIESSQGIYYNGSPTVTAEYTNSTQYVLDGTNAAYFVVYPQILAEGSTLTVAAVTEGYEISKDITVPTGGINLQAGKITTLNVNLLAAHINTASSGAALPFNDDMSWADNGSSDDGTDLVSTISTVSSGLYVSASKAYKGKGGLKLGTSSVSGSITTKDLNLSGAFYITIEAGKYGSDTGKIEVSIDGDDAVISSNDFSGVLYANVAAGTYTNKSKVTIATSSKRAYVYSVNIASGTYVAPPVISVTSSNPMGVANTSGTHTIEYTIDNPTSASISASANVAWIHDFDYSVDGEVSFDVDAQSSGDPARSGVITLSYTGAEDVTVTVNQAAGGGGKTEYTATLTIRSVSSLAATYTDDKGNTWNASSDAAGFTSNSSYLHAGSGSNSVSHITLSTSAYSSSDIDIKEVHVWAAAKANTGVTTQISIDGNLLGTSEVLGNTSTSGGTEYYVSNTSNYSGDIEVVISRSSAQKAAIYFNQLTVVYEAD